MFLFALVCTTFTAHAAIINVPADQPTIQAGINAANNGDTVLVAPGTYTENIDFKGKAIVVTSGATSFAAASATILQPANEGPIVVFQTGETPATVLNGFTIQKGYSPSSLAPGGDGIDILGASPTITNNIVTQNTGCGIFAVNAVNLTIRNNSIVNNVGAAGTPGDGPAHCGKSWDNFDNSPGIGIYVRGGGSVQIIGNELGNNSDGPISIDAVPHVLVENNLIEGGGGVFMSTSAPPGEVLLIQNIFYGPTPDLAGGFGYTPLESLDAIGNTASINNTFYNALLAFGVSPVSAKVANNVFSLNGPQHHSDGFDDLLECSLYAGMEQYSNLIANNNDIYPDGVPSISTDCPLSTGNLSSDPQFLSINPSSFDFHTQRTSPVVAAGDITAPNIPATDFAGKNRTVCGTIDMGAYEVHPQPPIAVSSSPNPSVGGSSVTFTAQLTGNCNIPTGTVTFLDGANVLGTALLNNSAVASFSTAALTVGSHAITVSYPGDFNFDPDTSLALTQVVTGYPTTTTLSVSPNPAVAFQPITFSSTVSSPFGTPTGTVTFAANGQTLASAVLNTNGIATATVSTVGAGTYNVIATYSADINFAASTSSVVVEKVLGADTATTLTADPNPLIFSQTLTLTSSVNLTQGSGTASGIVTFLDGTQSIGTAPLTAQGVAVLATFSLAVGTHSITASYPGSSNTNLSVSAPVSVTVNPSDFTLTLGQSSITVQTAQSATNTVSLTPIGTFSDTVALDCPNLPAHASCTFTPTTTTLMSGGTATVSLNIGTGTPGHVARNRTEGMSPFTVALLFAPFAGIFASRRRAPLRLLLLLLALLPIALPLAGCGDVTVPYIPSNATPPGTYTIPITATGITTGITHTAQLTLTVTP